MKAFAPSFLALVLLSSVLAASPLGAACSCSLSANLSAPDLVLSGTSSGTCPWRPKIEFSFNGAAIPYASRECSVSTDCSFTFTTAVTCRRTGSYTAGANCWCGKDFPLSDGGSYCGNDPEGGTDETSIFVYTTPSVGVSASGPDMDGLLRLTIPYSFPNTLLADPHRHLWVHVDGSLLDEAYGSQVSSTWTRTHGTACWRQGSHEIKAIAVACGQTGDAAFRAEAVTPVEIDHQPDVSVSLSPLDPTQPEGTQVAEVAYSFPQTASSNQRLLTLRVAPSGGSLGTVSPIDHEGTWRKNVSYSPGNNGWVEAVALACGETRAVAAAALPGCPGRRANPVARTRRSAVRPAPARAAAWAWAAADRVSAASLAGRLWVRERGCATWPAARAVRAIRARPPGTPSSAVDGPTTTRSGSCPRQGARPG
jgi:hypothetical protein